MTTAELCASWVAASKLLRASLITTMRSNSRFTSAPVRVSLNVDLAVQRSGPSTVTLIIEQIARERQRPDCGVLSSAVKSGH